MRPEVALPALGHLARGTWAIAPAESTARFRVRDKLVGTTSGSIPVRSGTVRLGAGGAVEDARVELDVAGIDTGNRHRDRDLRKPRFLAADEHPVIVVQTGPAVARPDGWRMTATLTARGAAVPVELAVTIVEIGEVRVRVRVTGRLDRTDLGMGVPTFVVGRMIDIDVDVVLRR